MGLLPNEDLGLVSSFAASLENVAKCTLLPQFELTYGIELGSGPFLRTAVSSYCSGFRFDLLTKLLVLGWVKRGKSARATLCSTAASGHIECG